MNKKARENFKERREDLNTFIAGLAFVLAAISLFMQWQERTEKHAEILSYEIGGQAVGAAQIDQYIKIYNQSERDIYLESVTLRADMGDGLSRLARIYEPSNPKELHPGSFKEFRFHCRPSTPADEAAENREQYKTFTGRSLVEAITTKGTRLTFESHYHPYFIDRLNAALAKSKLDENGALTLQ